MRFNVQFNEEKVYDVDPNDLYDLLDQIHCPCMNIINIKKNSFFIVMSRVQDAFTLYQKLNNYFIKEIQARIEILMCVESDKSSFPE